MARRERDHARNRRVRDLACDGCRNVIRDGRSPSRRGRPPPRLDAVEGLFAILTKRRLERGVFRLVTDLQAAVNRFLEEHNQQSKPLTRTADPDTIIAAVRRGRQALDSIP